MIFACVAEGKKYLLREESYVLNPDCIFVRNDTGTPELVYCPEYEKPISTQLQMLSDWFLNYINSADAAGKGLGSLDSQLFILMLTESLPSAKMKGTVIY